MRLDLQPTPKILRYLCGDDDPSPLSSIGQRGSGGGRRFDSIADLHAAASTRASAASSGGGPPHLRSSIRPAAPGFPGGALDVLARPLLRGWSSASSSWATASCGRRSRRRGRVSLAPRLDAAADSAANLYGVDVLPEAAETTRSRLLRLVARHEPRCQHPGRELAARPAPREGRRLRSPPGGGQPRLFRRTFRQAEERRRVET